MNTNNRGQETNTVGQSSYELLKIQVLSRRDGVIGSIAVYYDQYYQRKKRGQLNKCNIQPVISSLIALFTEMHSMIKAEASRNKSNIQFQERSKKTKELLFGLKEKEIKDYYDAFEFLDKILYEKRISALDNKTLTDTTDWEAENEAQGF